MPCVSCFQIFFLFLENIFNLHVHIHGLVSSFRRSCSGLGLLLLVDNIDLARSSWQDALSATCRSYCASNTCSKYFLPNNFQTLQFSLTLEQIAKSHILLSWVGPINVPKSIVLLPWHLLTTASAHLANLFASEMFLRYFPCTYISLNCYT